MFLREYFYSPRPKKTATIRTAKTARETGVSRNNGGPIESPLNPSLRDSCFDARGSKGGPQSGPHDAEIRQSLGHLYKSDRFCFSSGGYDII